MAASRDVSLQAGQAGATAASASGPRSEAVTVPLDVLWNAISPFQPFVAKLFSAEEVNSRLRFIRASSRT
jgi:hypothetical protein